MGIQATTPPSDNNSDESKFDPAEQESFENEEEVVFVGKDDEAVAEGAPASGPAPSAAKPMKEKGRKSDEEDDTQKQWRTRAIFATAFLAVMFLFSAVHEILTPPLDAPQQYVENNPSPVKNEAFALTTR